MIDAADKQRVADAIRAAESKTVGEITCVIAARASRYPLVPFAWSAAFALLIPLWLLLLTDASARMIYLAQLIGFALAFIVCMQPWLRRHLVPRLLQHDRAHRLATQQFAAQGLHKTAHRTGVMIFASQAERFAEIIADDGIDAKVAPDVWHGALVALLDGIKTDRPADGFVAAIAQCGEVLAAHFPRQASDAKVDELPDRLVEI